MKDLSPSSPTGSPQRPVGGSRLGGNQFGERRHPQGCLHMRTFAVLEQKGRNFLRGSVSPPLWVGVRERGGAAMRCSGVGTGGAKGRNDQQSSRMRPRQRGSGRAEGEGHHRAPEGQGGPNRGRAMMEAARARPRGERAPRAPRPGRDVAPMAVRHGRGVLVLYPFHGASMGRVSGMVVGNMPGA